MGSWNGTKNKASKLCNLVSCITVRQQEKRHQFPITVTSFSSPLRNVNYFLVSCRCSHMKISKSTRICFSWNEINLFLESVKAAKLKFDQLEKLAILSAKLDWSTFERSEIGRSGVWGTVDIFSSTLKVVTYLTWLFFYECKNGFGSFC